MAFGIRYNVVVEIEHLVPVTWAGVFCRMSNALFAYG
jgi:hypothetical protein